LLKSLGKNTDQRSAWHTIGSLGRKGTQQAFYTLRSLASGILWTSWTSNCIGNFIFNTEICERDVYYLGPLQCIYI